MTRRKARLGQDAEVDLEPPTRLNRFSDRARCVNHQARNRRPLEDRAAPPRVSLRPTPRPQPLHSERRELLAVGCGCGSGEPECQNTNHPAKALVLVRRRRQPPGGPASAGAARTCANATASSRGSLVRPNQMLATGRRTTHLLALSCASTIGLRIDGAVRELGTWGASARCMLAATAIWGGRYILFWPTLYAI